MRILLVSGDAALKDLLSGLLRGEGHEITLSESVSVTWRTIRGDFDLLIYDLGETAPPEWRTFARWRQLADLPMIVIGPLAQEEYAVRALHMGADDYMTRPLRSAELVARCEALVRRERMSTWLGAPEAEPEGELALSWRPHQVKIGGRQVDLTPIEFKLLEVLWRNRGHPVSRDELARQVWGKDRTAADSNLSLYIWHLRRKIEEDPKRPKLILTRWRMGYSFQEAAEDEDQALGSP